MSVFGLGGGAILEMTTSATVSAFQSAYWPPQTQAVMILDYWGISNNAFVVARVSAQPSHSWFFRSADRFLPDGSLDNTNGGFWVVSPAAGNTVDIAWAGAKSDGSTDNTTAFFTLSAWARTQTGLVNVKCTPNHSANRWMWDQVDTPTTDCKNFLMNVGKLVWDGCGTVFQKLSATFPAWPFAAAPSLVSISSNAGVGGYSFINSTAVGNTSVTCVTAADAGLFDAGTYAIVMSESIQGVGYPPNVDQFEYVKIVSVNAGTGVITLDRPLKYVHLSTFPKDINQPDHAYGPAMIAPLNNKSGMIYFRANVGSPISWDIDHTYKNMTIDQPVGGPGNVYWQPTGRTIRAINVGGAGHAETVCENFVNEGGGIITNFAEPDKLVESVAIADKTYLVDLALQSASIHDYTLRNVHIRGTFGPHARRTTVLGGSCQSLTVMSNGLGLQRATTIQDMEVRSVSNFSWQSGSSLAVDGVNIIFANGVLKFLKAGPGSTQYFLRPGSQLMILPTGSPPRMRGDNTIGYVVQKYEDATYVYVVTTLPYTSLPAWATGNIMVLQTEPKIINCFGCDAVNRISEGSRRGKRLFEFFSMTWVGANAEAGPYWLNNIVGRIKRASMVVTNPTTIPGAYLQLQFTLYNPLDPSAAASIGLIRMKVDLTLSGKREFNCYYNGGGDVTTIGGIDQIQWSTDGGSTFANFNASTVPLPGLLDYSFSVWAPTTWTGQQPYQIPIVDIEIESDQGLLNKPLTTVSSDSGVQFNPVVGGLG